MYRQREVEKIKIDIRNTKAEITKKQKELDSLYKLLSYYDDNSFAKLLGEVLESVEDTSNYRKTYKESQNCESLVIKLDEIITDKKLRLHFLKQLNNLNFVKEDNLYRPASWNNKTTRCLILSLETIEVLKMYYSSGMIE